MGVMDRLNVRSEYQILNEAIKNAIRRSAADVVMLGHLLRRMMDEKLWEGHYGSLDEYLRQELHMDYTMACRFEAINRKYSIGGRSGHIDEKWEDYSQGVLIEMLNMPPELEAEVTPDMTVRQVRELKRQARQKKENEKTERKAFEEKPAEEVSPPQAGVGYREAPEEPVCASLPERRCQEESPQGEIPDAEFREVEMPVDGAVQCPEPEIREKVATSQPEKSAYGLEKTVYPEGSLLSGAGCGNKYHCFSCAQDCDIRQKYRYCVFAPLGNSFGCDRMEVLGEIKAGVGERCQFINNSLAKHKAGTGEAAPCCTDCTEDCAFRCQRSCRMEADRLQEARWDSTQGEKQDGGIRGEMAEVKGILAGEQKMLDDFLEASKEDGSVLKAPMYRRLAVIVSALTEMLRRMEDAETGPEPGGQGQPPLPPLKNNDQRREWLKSYKDWGLWYRDENIGAEYYKFDFDNGARLIAEVYQEEATKYCGAYESCFLHLVGGPEPPKGQSGAGKWAGHTKYSRYPNSETELVEFLKVVQRNG